MADWSSMLFWDRHVITPGSSVTRPNPTWFPSNCLYVSCTCTYTSSNRENDKLQVNNPSHNGAFRSEVRIGYTIGDILVKCCYLTKLHNSYCQLPTKTTLHKVQTRKNWVYILEQNTQSNLNIGIKKAKLILCLFKWDGECVTSEFAFWICPVLLVNGQRNGRR